MGTFASISPLNLAQNITERASTSAWTGGLGGFMTNTMQAQPPSALPVYHIWTPCFAVAATGQHFFCFVLWLPL